MEDVKPDKFLDCSGLLCPMPVVKTKRAIKDLDIGQVLEMISTDPGAVPDMEAWARQTQHELLLAEQKGEEDIYRFLVRKTH